MKILHTSDWHIGKRLAGRERLDEQAAVLNEIASVCDREGVELVLVAGDVFDNYLPSARAESVFYAAVKEIAGKDRCVLAISGNHDDNVRLTAGGVLAGGQGIYIFGNGRRVPATTTGGVAQVVDFDGTAVGDKVRVRLVGPDPATGGGG